MSHKIKYKSKIFRRVFFNTGTSIYLKFAPDMNEARFNE